MVLLVVVEVEVEGELVAEAPASMAATWRCAMRGDDVSKWPPTVHSRRLALERSDRALSGCAAALIIISISHRPATKACRSPPCRVYARPLLIMNKITQSFRIQFQIFETVA
jgi:hypothetical protein